MKTSVESENPVSNLSNNINTSKLGIIGLLLVVAVLLGFAAFTKRSGTTGVPQAPVFNERGSLNLTSDEAAKGVRIGAPITLRIVADSDKNTIKGFDIVLNYDKDLVSYVNTTNLAENFQIVAVEREGRVIITGFEKPGTTTSMAFSNKTIAQISFVAKSSGKAFFNLAFEPGKTTDSNLIDSTGKEKLGKVGGVSLEIK